MRILREFEDRVIVPLLAEANIEPVRTNVPIMTSPGSITFLMNNANDYEAVEGGGVRWFPLTVLYRDDTGRIDEVFRYEGRSSHDGQQIVTTDIAGLLRLELNERNAVSWRDPLSGRHIVSIANTETRDVMKNAWYIFRGGILPGLYDRSWRFSDDPAERRFRQALMLKRIATSYGMNE